MRSNGQVQGSFDKYELQLRNVPVGKQYLQRQQYVVYSGIHGIL
jgi:hypothetical protein